MENQISQLIVHLESHALVQAPSEHWQDRGSGALRIRAVFDDGQSFTVNIHDKATILQVKALFQENLKKVFSKTSAFRDLFGLTVGDRYTVLVESEMGFGVHAVQMTLDSIKVGRYAQYDNCIDLIFKPKGKRNLHCIKFYGRKAFAIFAGWVNVNTDPFGPTEDLEPMTVKKMKYASCDDRFMTDAIASAGVAPIISKLFETNNTQGGQHE